jgi:tetratricopeptide (TPR) repeat protein
MDNFTYIDDYFKGSRSTEKQKDFEVKIVENKEFADDVAFYITMNQAALVSNSLDKKARFREIYKESITQATTRSIKRMWPSMAMAAAALAILVFGLYLYLQPVNPSKIADNYLTQNLGTLHVQMGNTRDLLQTGIGFYNDKEFLRALETFEEAVKKDPSNYEAKEDAGIAALQIKDYNKAIYYFKLVAGNDELRENHGKFYQALALMKRNKNSDEEQYLKLLREVINENNFGKSEAESILRKYN